MWDRKHVEQFSWPRLAEERYAERKLALAERGFIYSDMDPIF
jgi:hypothetical protein